MSNNVHSTASLKNRLLDTFERLERKKTFQSVIDALIIIAVWVTVFILIEKVSYLPIELKSFSLISLIALSCYVIWNGRKNIRKTEFIDFYRSFSAKSNLKELSYALDLEKNTVANPKLIEAAIFKNLELVNEDQLINKLEEFYRDNSLTRSSKRKWLLLSIALVVGLFTALNFDNATYRYLTFFQEYQKPNPFLYTVNPGNTTLEQGSPFIVSIAFENGIIPNEVSLFLKTPVEEEFRKRGMDNQSNIFSSSSIELNTDISYYLEMDGFKTEIFDANVQLRPRLVDFTVTIVPPEYTRMDTVRFNYPFSQVQGIQGSEMILSGKVNKPLNEFLVKNTEFEQDGLINEDLEFYFISSISQPDTIQFILEDENGLENINPFQFQLSPIIDEFPIAEILEPNSSYEEIEPKQIELLYRTSDDFGITQTNLSYELRRAFVEEADTETINFGLNRNGILQTFLFDFDSLALKPKDELTFWIETSDNDGFNGFKTSRSEAITLTVPSLIDYFEEIDNQEEEVQSDLENISESFEEMQDQYEMFKEQLRDDPEVDYQDLRQLQEVKERQEQIREQLDDLNEKFEELKEELNESDLLSEETLQAYEELQKLMEEIDDPAFREALEQLQENLNSMTPEQLREAMQNTEFNEQLYKERLERTIELFKQLQLNADLEKLAQSYEDLARQEEEQSNNTDSSFEEQQESLLEQTEQVEEQLNKLEENTTSNSESTIRELQEQSKEKLDEIKEELQNRLEGNQDSESNNESNEDSGEQSDQEQSEQQQNNGSESQEPQLQQKFNQLAEMTRSAMSQMNQEQLNVNIAGLQYILYTLINLSLEQEELTTYASGAESRSQAYIGYARDQKNVEDIFSTVSDSLFELSKEIPAFSNQINEEKLEVKRLLEQSLFQMAERNQSRASVATRQSLGGINKISYMIAGLLEQLQNQSNGQGGSGSGMSVQQMIEQMQEMGQNQQQINQQIQDMINDIQGERLSQDQMDRLDQLSRQQNEIRKQLQEMQQNGGAAGGDEIGSELERMIEQMEETINDLRGGAVDPTLIERQQNILSRMLEAEDALQERDEEEKREGAAGEEINRVSPPEITLEELEQQIRNRLNDPNFTKYSPDYQRLIERYFELLKEIQNREI
jgi:hypothetical protein